ncbi:MAG: peptidylprolyl isomerase, partial [Bacteroidales bacterium]
HESSGSQFYIVQGQVFNDATLDMLEQRNGTTFTEAQRKAYTTDGGTPHLDGAYTVFGQVADGFDVIDKIAAVKTGQMDRPVEDVKMTIEIIE